MTYEKVDDRTMRKVEEKTFYTAFSRCVVEEMLKNAEREVARCKGLLAEMDKLGVTDKTDSDI